MRERARRRPRAARRAPRAPRAARATPPPARPPSSASSSAASASSHARPTRAGIPRDYALEWSGALGCILAGIALLMRKLPTGVKLSKEMKEIA